MESVRFEVLAALTTKVIVYWGMKLCVELF
jgi:hypothetical protein